MSVLFNGIIVMAFMPLMVIEVAAGGPGIFFGILYFLYGLGRIIPRLAVSTRRLNEEAQRGGSTRRLNDTDRSGWYNLIVLVPLFGFIVLIFFDCQDSTPGANRFGANPKVRYANSRTMD